MDMREVFAADLAKMNAQLLGLNAVVIYEDGFTGIDASKVPCDLLAAYTGLTSYGYANGLI